MELEKLMGALPAKVLISIEHKRIAILEGRKAVWDEGGNVVGKTMPTGLQDHIIN